jgi:hypothetical protein
MPRTRVLALVLGSFGAIFGQVPGGPPHVRGSVVDSSTHQPIPNARVQLGSGGSAITSVSGNYDIVVAQPGSYDLKVEAQGYLTDREHYSIVVAAESESTTLDMQMYRPGVISGRLIDAETKQPIAGVAVSARRVIFRLGRASMEPDSLPVLMIMPGNNLQPSQVRARITDKQGVFRIEPLRPGTYSLGFPPSLEERLLNSDTPQSTAAVSGYRRQSWPNAGTSAGVELHAGNLLELGDITLTREPLYRITGVLTGCTRGDDLSRGARLTTRDGTGVSGGAMALLACGERFSAENLSPGEYLFDLNFEGIGQIRVGQVTVVNRDVEYSPVLSLPLTIAGSVIVPENFPAGQLTVRTIPGRTTVKVAADGRFEMTQGIGEPVEVRVESLPPPYYVSEILYNGAPLRDGILEVNPYSIVRELKIRIAADGASVNGTVRKEDKPAPNSSVVLMAWPERQKNGFPVHYVANAPYGQLTLSGVPPGSYRAIAVEREAWETELQKPGVLSGLASAGTQVDLAPSGSKELTLEVRWIQLSQ